MAGVYEQCYRVRTVDHCRANPHHEMSMLRIVFVVVAAMLSALSCSARADTDTEDIVMGTLAQEYAPALLSKFESEFPKYAAQYEVGEIGVSVDGKKVVVSGAIWLKERRISDSRVKSVTIEFNRVNEEWSLFRVNEFVHYTKWANPVLISPTLSDRKIAAVLDVPNNTHSDANGPFGGFYEIKINDSGQIEAWHNAGSSNGEDSEIHERLVGRKCYMTEGIIRIKANEVDCTGNP